jgi:hypothetical protein
MSRRIIETELQASGHPSDVDSYLDKVMKYIPLGNSGSMDYY